MDAQDGPKTQEFWLRRLSFTGSEDFWSQSRQIYWVDDPKCTKPCYVGDPTCTTACTDEGKIVGGYWRHSDYFEYLTVPKAGHFVPANYYLPSYSFFQDYIAG